MPASSKWKQLCSPNPLCTQSTSLLSTPLHCTLSSQICPLPEPKANCCAEALLELKPNCLQATCASRSPNRSSQTVPHWPR